MYCINSVIIITFHFSVQDTKLDTLNDEIKKLSILCSILSDGKYYLDENKSDFILKIKQILNDNTSQNEDQISVWAI